MSEHTPYPLDDVTQDLLEALRNMVAWLKSPPISHHNIADYLVAAEDAIAKAEGRS